MGRKSSINPCSRFHIRRLKSDRLLLDSRNEVSYPDAAEADDGYIYVAYDWERVKQREILMAKFTEEDILCGTLTSAKGRLKILVNKALGQPDIHN